MALALTWWRRVDSNHRSETQQIYSLPPLATRELLRMKFWSWWTDSNPRPADYKSAALPTELHQRFSSQLVHNVAYYIRQMEGCQQEKQKNLEKFEGRTGRPRGQERKHEREDFYRSAAGYAAGTGGGLVPALPEGDLRLGAGGGGGPVSPVPGGGKTRGNGAKQRDS